MCNRSYTFNFEFNKSVNLIEHKIKSLRTYWEHFLKFRDEINTNLKVHGLTLVLVSNIGSTKPCKRLRKFKLSHWIVLTVKPVVLLYNVQGIPRSREGSHLPIKGSKKNSHRWQQSFQFLIATSEWNSLHSIFCRATKRFTGGEKILQTLDLPVANNNFNSWPMFSCVLFSTYSF